MFDGLGTELGMLNTFLLTVGGGTLLFMAQKVKLWIKTDWEKHLKQHGKMWKDYVKNHLDDTGNFD